MKPLISVIVPVYNGQDFLFNCIKSIEAQTYPNLEVIIINDGSTDQTEAVCENAAYQYDNIQLIGLGDEGVSAARNAGITAAKGEYITFVDADDRLLPRALQLLYESLVETNSDIAGCSFESWSSEQQWEQILEKETNEGIRAEIEKSGTQIYSGASFISEGILKGNSRCWSKLYKRTLIGDIRFRRGLTIGEDMLFLVDLLPQVKKIVEIPYKGYGYYQNPAGAMNRAFRPEYMDQIICWELARDRIDCMWEAVSGKETVKPELAAKKARVHATTILIMAVMLTAGKLALLSGKERRRQAEYIKKCHATLQRELQVPGAYEQLSAGYKVKAKLFCAMPDVYLWLYHLKKFGGLN
ncbi:glycosyltransferase family 2 protein [Parablautia muri]|nr:glycosyltransferase [Parablautia muri]